MKFFFIFTYSQNQSSHTVNAKYCYMYDGWLIEIDRSDSTTKILYI